MMSRITDRLLSRDEHICPWWLAWTFDNPLRKWLHDPQKVLGAYVREGMIVADVGCGMGYFSVAMARMVGQEGRVLAVDVQQMMLDLLKKRAFRAGIRDRISTVLAAPDDIQVAGPVDFVLAFWMIHEVKDLPRFFGQIATALKSGGRMLYAEPRMHVTQNRFDEILGHARGAGFSVVGRPKVGMSRAALLVRG